LNETGVITHVETWILHEPEAFILIFMKDSVGKSITIYFERRERK